MYWCTLSVLRCQMSQQNTGFYLVLQSVFFPLQVRLNDLAFYENRTDPSGPAMTHAMFAIGWLEVGNKQKAEKSFLKNYANIQGPFKVFHSF